MKTTASVLLILTLLVVAGTLYWKKAMKPTREQARAIIENQGGLLSYDFTSLGIINPDPKGVAFVQLRAGSDVDPLLKVLPALNPVYGLSLEGSVFKDSRLSPLSALPSLQALNLDDSSTNDSDMAMVGKLHQLRQLSLKHTSITDAGLLQLKDLTGLVELLLVRVPVNGTGLSALRASALRELVLDHTQLDDRGAANLRLFPTLQTLSMVETKVGDTGIQSIGALVQLRTLLLDHCPFTGGDLKFLLPLTALDALSLNNIKLAEEAVPTLMQLKSLKLLSIVQTGLSAEAVSRIRAALPGCEVRG